MSILSAIGKGVGTIGKGIGAVAGGTVGGATGVVSRAAKGGGGILKEAMSGVKSGAKAAYDVTSGSAAARKKLAAKTAKEATEKTAMQTRRLNQAQNALNPNFIGPHQASVIDDARKLNTLNNAKNPNFIGPMQSDAQLRSINREVQRTMTPDFIGPMPIAQDMAESGAGFWSGLGEMIEDHPYIAAGIAGGVGVAGGALLFGDDDDDY